MPGENNYCEHSDNQNKSTHLALLTLGYLFESNFFINAIIVLTNVGNAEHKKYIRRMVWGRHGKLNDEPTTVLLPGWCTLNELYTCAPLTIRYSCVIMHL